MEPGLSTSLAHRPPWTIDLRLERWLGQDVRVAAESFFPIRWNGEVLPLAIPVRDLILPDNTPDAPGQLYNLEADPGETRNLYFDQPRIVKELKALPDTSKASGRSRPKSPDSNP